MIAMIQPTPYDAVLGGLHSAPLGSVVLGGLAGVYQRFAPHQPIPQRIAALQESLSYGEEGFHLVATAIHDPVLEIQKAAYQFLLQVSTVEAWEVLHQFPPYVLFRCQQVYRGHTSPIAAIALQPDQELIASLGRDRILSIRDLPTGDVMASIPLACPIDRLTFWEHYIVVRETQEARWRAWSWRNGQELEADVVEREIRPYYDPSGAVTSVGELAEELEGAIAPLKLRRIASVATTPQRHLITGSQSSIRIWDLNSGREIASLHGHTGRVTALYVSPDGQTILSGSDDCTLRRWGIV
jgi:WD40 repeat protein